MKKINKGIENINLNFKLIEVFSAELTDNYWIQKLFAFGQENAHCISQLTCQEDYQRKKGYRRKS